MSLKTTRDGNLLEDSYDMDQDARHSALFTTGNGYMGVRGSFEEFGSARIQGAYIRGLFDEIVEVMEPFPDNEYMKKYYFDEEALRDFEKQDSCINFADILYLRFQVGAYEFYPWCGTLLKWERRLNFSTAELIRNVTWRDPEGNITRFEFRRFASYDNPHLYVLRARAVPVNHRLPIRAQSGVDKHVRTGGQRILEELREEASKNRLLYSLTAGGKYGFQAGIGVLSECKEGTEELACAASRSRNGRLYTEFVAETGGFPVEVTKTVYVNISRDHPRDVWEEARKGADRCRGQSYTDLLDAHLSVWRPLWRQFFIEIGGDAKAQGALNFSTFHSVIAASAADSVHGLSAKTLSGERYNQFVWWDAEIYQLPILIHACPKLAENALIYRYNQLDDARANAAAEGFKGARFPFVASVGGAERVWKYARHPRLQIHITADVGYGVVNYFQNTRDIAFMRRYGFELLAEIGRYWASRCERFSERFEIRRVTGTDEHHPYVDNDAYTNYLVRLLFCSITDYCGEFPAMRGLLDDEEYSLFTEIRDGLYLPQRPDGLIPQFDGYFDLSRELRVEGSGTGKNFQMRESGLYHLSQVIKQPDVMLLYAYLDYPFREPHYAKNWDYYESMCESSSSLSYPVHAICSADNGRMLSFYRYFMQTVRMDLDDVHNCAWQGIHGGCAAGGYYAVLRGLFGVRTGGATLRIEPADQPFWPCVSLRFRYRGVRVRLRLKDGRVTVRAEGGTLEFESGGIPRRVRAGGSVTWSIR